MSAEASAVTLEGLCGSEYATQEGVTYLIVRAYQPRIQREYVVSTLKAGLELEVKLEVGVYRHKVPVRNGRVHRPNMAYHVPVMVQGLGEKRSDQARSSRLGREKVPLSSPLILSSRFLIS